MYSLVWQAFGGLTIRFTDEGRSENMGNRANDNVDTIQLGLAAGPDRATRDKLCSWSNHRLP
jgi:hypothetical protein